MSSRNENREILINSHKMYSNMAKRRGINFFRQFGSPRLKKISAEDFSKITTLPHIWNVGDRYYKLAGEFYGNAEYWWLIAWFNEKPTEAHVKIGDPIYIPIPFEDALRLYNDI